MVFDIILKFNWLYYLPPNGPPYWVRAFICKILDMLRRWLWNFFRLENEHLSNVEQYRVTREVHRRNLRDRGDSPMYEPNPLCTWQQSPDRPCVRRKRED